MVAIDTFYAVSKLMVRQSRGLNGWYKRLDSVAMQP